MTKSSMQVESAVQVTAAQVGPMQIGPLRPRGLFGRCHRLRKRSDFSQVFRDGHRSRGVHFAVIARPCSPASPGCRLGLAVNRKSGNAPARARLRRLIREAFRSLRYDMALPTEVVVRTLLPWPDADLAQVHAELSGLFMQLDGRLRRGPNRRRRSKRRGGNKAAHATT